MSLQAPPAVTGRPLHRLVLAAWAAVCFAANLFGGGYSWHYFVQGSSVLFAGGGAQPPGGLHLYAHYPDLQIGPLALLVARAIRLAPPDASVVLAQTVMMLSGLLVLYLVESTALSLRPELAADGARLRRTMLVGGAAFLAVWASLAVYYAHLDDVLALALTAVAVRAMVADAPALAGIALGLAVDAKPWALVFVPLVLALPRGRRRHMATCTLLLIAAAWLPFVLGDPGTLGAAGYAITNEPSSALRALGVTTAGTPSWDRPAQLLLGLALGALAVRRGRWPAVIVLGIAARMLLDPGVYDYYTAGLLLGTLCWEALCLRHPVPLWSPVCFLALYAAPRLTSDSAVLGGIRLWLLLSLAATVLLLPGSWCARVRLPRPASAPAGCTRRAPVRQSSSMYSSRAVGR